jgi:hypothetical protein
MSEQEEQLLKIMKADAAIWERRTIFMEGATGPEPTKFELTRKRAEAARMVRAKVARATSSTYRPRKVHGTMQLVEKLDKLCAPTVKCGWCGQPFGAIVRGKRAPPLYCGKACSHASWRARKILANG